MLKKVYVVLQCDDGWSKFPVGVFSSRDLADASIQKHLAGKPNAVTSAWNLFEVEEFELDSSEWTP